MDGVSQCARYAFGPNRLHLCGPDANREVLAYLNEGVADGGLTQLLTKFKTLYPYLETIAHANHIDDPLDARVIEAYWLGNELLETVGAQTLFRHFSETLSLKRHLAPHAFTDLTDKLDNNPAPHHNFHVMNVWKRTGHANVEHTLESMDQCRISWGRVTGVDGPFITVERQPLTLNGVFSLGAAVPVKIIRRLDDSSLMEDVAADEVISLHWGMPCEVLTNRQLENLKRYTQQSLVLANSTPNPLS